MMSTTTRYILHQIRPNYRTSIAVPGNDIISYHGLVTVLVGSNGSSAFHQPGNAPPWTHSPSDDELAQQPDTNGCRNIRRGKAYAGTTAELELELVSCADHD